MHEACNTTQPGAGRCHGAKQGRTARCDATSNVRGAPHFDRPDLRDDAAVRRKREDRFIFLQRVRSRARSEVDAIGAVVAAEKWIEGALTLFVGQPNELRRKSFTFFLWKVETKGAA